MGIIGVLSVELFLPESHSLKEKRMVLRRVKDRLKRFNVAVAETEYQDLWQRAGLEIVAISTGDDAVRRQLVAAADEIERVEPGLIARTRIELLT
jgi:uncharacterized protein YlxP (DUF503 family)